MGFRRALLSFVSEAAAQLSASQAVKRSDPRAVGLRDGEKPPLGNALAAAGAMMCVCRHTSLPVVACGWQKVRHSPCRAPADAKGRPAADTLWHGGKDFFKSPPSSWELTDSAPAVVEW